MTGSTGNESDITRRLENTAFKALRILDHPTPEPRLVRVGSTAIFRDRKAGLIVRIGGDREEMQRNLRISIAMHQVGIPALQPVLVEPLDIDGSCVTVWPLVEGGQRPSPQWLGRTACVLHDQAAALSHALTRADVSLRPFAEDELGKARERIAKASATDDFSRRDLAAFLEKIEESDLLLAELQDRDRVVVHGDLYPGNTVSTGEETLLIDLDMVSLGPRVVDSVPELVRERRFPGSGASYSKFIDGYGHAPADTATLQLFVNLREITMVSWIVELATRKPSVADEARHRLITISRGLDSEPWTAA